LLQFDFSDLFVRNENNFQNILVIDFGQLGDVVLSLPALKAIRERFAEAKITLFVGKSPAQFARISGLADEVIMVDRVELRDGPRLRSIREVFRIVGDIRRRRFDLVIDLHSLSETNLLGFLSGAKYRLYANRENRSLDRLGRFPSKPALEDKSMHLTDRYLDVLRPLGINDTPRFVEIAPPEEDIKEIRALYTKLGLDGKTLIGLFLGAGHPSRRWSVGNFAELTKGLIKDESSRVLVFLGPEEFHLLDEIHEKFPPGAIILDKLKLLPLFAALSLLDVLVSNDTGPMHLAAIAGARIVLIWDKRGNPIFMPLTEKLTLVSSGTIDEIGVDEVFNAVNDSASRYPPR
jgi:ADP-heptose:LPS heptosyltransferase